MLALALPLPILVGEVCGPLPLPYLILELVGGQVTGRRGDWAEDADAHPVDLTASPSYHQIPKHLFDIHLASGQVVGRQSETGQRTGCPILVDSCATRATVESASATENLPPHARN